MTQEENALEPVEERIVDFYGDALVAALVSTPEEQQVFVPVRPLCDYLGIQWSAQRRRILRDPVMADELQPVMVTAADGKRREASCLPLEFIPGWLFGINVNRVREDLKDKIVRYQRECFRVLWQAFQTDAFTPLAAPEPSSPNTAALVQIREMGYAIAQMAEQQIELERAVSHNTNRLDQAAIVVGQIRKRLGSLERMVAPGEPITDEQAAEISARVKLLAELLSRHDPSKNHYQGVFTELHRRFGVTSYKLVPQTRYADVLDFLESWRQAVADGGAQLPDFG